MGWHKEQALRSPTNLSYASHFLFGGCCYRYCFQSESRDLGCCCHPTRAGGVTPSTGLHVYEAGTQAAESFIAIAPTTLPQDDLDGPCHERLVSPWGVWNVIPLSPESRVAYPLDVLGGAVLLICGMGGQGQGQP